MNPSQQEQLIEIAIGADVLQGNLTIPPEAKGLVLFAHGSGSSRFSPRNRFVASMLNEGQLATLLIDLLTSQEEELDDVTREHRFNIDMLAIRLILVTDWLLHDERTRGLHLGYFGSSTGAAGALVAAAEKKDIVKAVVSRGGRPDLAYPILAKVTAPTLLIVGGNDYGVIELNQKAYDVLPCEKKMEIVPGATHLFEEQGALAQVSQLARQWFLQHF